MRYDNDALRDLLSADYALGHMRGAARRRFEKLQEGDIEWRHMTRWWADRISLLAQTVDPVTPSDQVWRTIEWRLFGARLPEKSGWWKKLTVVSSALAFTFALLFMGQFALENEPAPGAFEYTLLQDASDVPGWIVTLDSQSGQASYLRIAALPKLDPVPEHAYELWLLPQGGRKPVSLGLLPKAGMIELAIAADARLLLASGALAVSLEPAGGSPTGQPTGPVLYQGKPSKL